MTGYHISKEGKVKGKLGFMSGNNLLLKRKGVYTSMQKRLLARRIFK
jgi:hypothetical protein